MADVDHAGAGDSVGAGAGSDGEGKAQQGVSAAAKLAFANLRGLAAVKPASSSDADTVHEQVRGAASCEVFVAACDALRRGGWEVLVCDAIHVCACV